MKGNYALVRCVGIFNRGRRLYRSAASALLDAGQGRLVTATGKRVRRKPS